ncbi:glycosyl transferase [Lipomyces tetrasporus]|uniref:UDP-N-acetylglucosamine transferase subunit ALG13 n=1 Tax=Lipomyces tetrasporus TaxID=54092 RepID=A0AAD7VU65_9ASCO|nr:glycosyl transferase [Lipomyces tetrasporus]KAJ8101711.1 glycosyl transferase [Lipomyces tetrasporus]
MPCKVLVTTGATYPFDGLIKLVFTLRVLKALSTLGVTHLQIQYGNTPTSRIVYENCVENCQTVIQSTGIKVNGFGMTEDMATEIRSSWLVISHAGTGTILDTLRSPSPKPRLIVVPNPILMHGHQAEVAAAMEDMNCLLYAKSATEDSIISALDKLDRQFTELPEKKSLAGLIDYEAGVLRRDKARVQKEQ